MKFYNPISLLLLLGATNLFAANGGGNAPEKKTIEAVRIEDKPKIDGVLDDQVYLTAKPYEGDFFQMSPDNGHPRPIKLKYT